MAQGGGSKSCAGVGEGPQEEVEEAVGGDAAVGRGADAARSVGVRGLSRVASGGASALTSRDAVPRGRDQSLPSHAYVYTCACIDARTPKAIILRTASSSEAG
jgi:hypothetical protein